ncbi:MAG: DUF3151 family protein [Acidimicrobiales bacterium]|nr:DUF3151 family protein [Acidimicrobiales bacterium]
MSDRPVNLTTSGPPETVLDPEPADALVALGAARSASDPVSAIGAVCARWPRFLAAWASLGDTVDEPALKYAAYRTGYHRGLDRLRANGWRGSGYVRWQHETNQGFLRALAGLQSVAAQIGEDDEDARCAIFLRQLDPEWPPS